MTLQRTPSILIFDVNETLLDLTSLEPLFARIFGEGRVMREWFAQLVLYSQTLTLSGAYATFSDLASGVLRMVGTTSRVAVTDDDVAELKKMIGSMPAHADAAPALARLRDAGFRLVTLTNSPPSPAPTPLERAGLAQYFEAAYSVDTVKKFKPAVETYRLVADELASDWKTPVLLPVTCGKLSAHSRREAWVPSCCGQVTPCYQPRASPCRT